MSITSANSVFTLGIAGVFAIPQQLQGYDVDDVFGAEPVEPAEIKMGVDGKLSSGFVPVPTKVTITLMADSASNLIFEAWYAAQQTAKDTFPASGLITIPATARQYQMTNGTLTRYPPIPDAKKTLQARKYEITFESVAGAPL